MSAPVTYSGQFTQHYLVGEWIKSNLTVFLAVTDLSSAFDFMTTGVSGLLLLTQSRACKCSSRAFTVKIRTV